MKSRWDQIEKGMRIEEVREIFGSDMWKLHHFSDDTWAVNNEADKNADHGYTITFDEHGYVKNKGCFSVG